MIPKIISADDHVIEPANVWQDRVPSKHREKAPKIVIAPQGEMTLNDGVWVETTGTGEKVAA